jgi:MFS family permease
MSAAARPRFDPARRRAVTFALVLVTSLSSFESTVVTTAMPTIIGELHGLPLYAWVFSAYLFASTVTMPFYGRLADVHGRRKMLLVAIALFLGGSLLCALARTMPHLIVARGLQGLGAGGLIPLALTVSGDLYSLEERARIQGLFSSIWGLGSLVGPLAGAFLTMSLGWRSIFVLNLPLGLLAAWIVATQMIESHGTTPESPAAALRALFARRAVVVPYLSSTLMGVALYGVSTYVPLFVQGARGGSAGAAGAVITPLILCWAVSATAGGRLILAAGFRRSAELGGVLLVLGFGGLVTAALRDASTGWIVAACAVIGLGLGPTALAQLLAVQEEAPEPQRGIATSLVPFFRTVGGTVGVAAMGAVLSAGLAARFGPALESASRALAGEAPPPPGFRVALERSLLPVFWVLLVAALFAVGVATRFPGGSRAAIKDEGRTRP